MIQTKLKKKDFEEILSNYYIGEYKKSRHIPWALGNTVYILETSKGKFVLKIFENIQDLGYINYQIKIAYFLSKKKVSVPKIVKTKRATCILRYNKKKVLIQRFIEGKKPLKLSNDMIKDIAKKMSLMNKNLMKLKLTGKYVWKKDHEFKLLDYKNTDVNKFNFKEECMSLLSDLKSINRKRLRKSVVHGDCHSVNLLVKGSKLNAIIDWDDVHEDYLIYEVSTFITHSFLTTKGLMKEFTKLFLKEYQKNVSFSNEEKKAIYYFIKQRLLTIMEWDEDQMRKHPDMKEYLQRFQNSIVKKYNAFNKISLEEFMELIG